LQYKTLKKGSTLLFVLLVSSGLMISAVSYWYASTLRQSLMADRIRYEQYFRMAQGALNYGILYAHNHFSELSSSQDKSIDLSQYARLLDDHYTARVVFFGKKQSVLVKAYVCYDQDIVLCIQCCVGQNAGRQVVSEWKIGD